jgi:hypothetical protein
MHYCNNVKKTALLMMLAAFLGSKLTNLLKSKQLDSLIQGLEFCVKFKLNNFMIASIYRMHKHRYDIC